jgi:hypothetical protein
MIERIESGDANGRRKKGAQVNIRRAVKALVLVATVAMISAPAKARAEGYTNPWAGIIFAGNDISVDNAVSSAKNGFHSFGVSVGDTGHMIGLDVNLGYSPNFYDNDLVDNNVLDLMAGITAGPQFGRSAHSIRPYAVGGVGLLRRSFGDSSSNDFGFNVGAGIFGYFSNHLGLRGEVRYYRTLNGSDLGDFHFTRAQLGLLLR